MPADTNVPLLRQLYYGGATENYIYTNTSAADWGTELAHFRSDSPSDGDLHFPSDLWTLKEADSGNGGKIVISSAHIEASIFHTAIGDAGMTECQSEFFETDTATVLFISYAHITYMLTLSLFCLLSHP